MSEQQQQNSLPEQQPEQQQPEQQQPQQQQPEQQQPQQQQQHPSLPEFLFPFTFVIRQQPSSQNTNDQSTTSPSPPPVAAHFFFYPINGTGVGSSDQTPPPFIFFTPFFFPQENQKNVSDSTMKKLPIIEITQEHIDAQVSCPICLEPFTLPPDNDGQRNNENSTDKETSPLPEPIRQMPCRHTFCESCLFRWLKQNNTCPLCRKEIESENISQQSEQTTESTTVSPQEDVATEDASLSTSTESNSSFSQFSHTHSSHYHHNNNPQVSTNCALRNVGCCGELQSNEEIHSTSPIVTLPQCHHQFHASCLRTSLIVEGYSFESSTSQQLCFHCPTCRSPAIIQSDMLKIPSSSLPDNLLSPQEQQQPSLTEIPVIIPHFPSNPDEMDLD